MRLFLMLAFVALASLAGGFVFREFNLGESELRFIADFGFGGMTLFGSVIAVVVTVQLLFGEIEHRTIMTVLSKPVSRAEFVAGKLIGVWLTTFCFIAVLALTLLVALWVRETQLAAELGDAGEMSARVSYSGVLAFALLQVGRLAVLSSATAFFCSYATSSLFALFMGFFFWLLGQAQSVALDQLASAQSWWSQGLLWFLSVAVPNLRAFDVGGRVLEGEMIGAALWWELVAYAALYTLLYASFAATILRKREL